MRETPVGVSRYLVEVSSDQLKFDRRTAAVEHQNIHCPRIMR